jgi:prepilin-type N-terminal cleavage/methylation domain-containing protein
MKKTSSCRRRQAFTLIELLVVIGIIALLMGLLMPTISGVMDRSREVACQSNLRQLALACFSMAGDNDGNLPENYKWITTDYTTTIDTMITAGTLYPYVKDTRPYHCPTYYRLSGANSNIKRASYTMNFRVAPKSGSGVSDPGPWNSVTIGGMARPAACVFLAEENPQIAPWFPTTVNGVQMGIAGLNDGRLCWAFGTETWQGASVRDALATIHRDASCMMVSFDGHASRIIMDDQFKWKHLRDPVAP